MSIHIVPDEILVDIFTLYGDAAARATDADSTDPAECYRGCEWICGAAWMPLMLVCRAWRALAVATPCLWQRVDVWTNTEWLSLALARSCDAPLDLFLHDPATARAVVPMLLPHAPRLRKLLLPPLDMEIGGDGPNGGSQPRDISWCLPLLSCRPRLLEELVLPARSAGRNDQTTRCSVEDLLSEASTPALRILRLACASLPWDTRMVSRLACLDLQGCVHDGARMSCDGFLDVLASCRSLQELRLADRFISGTLSPGALVAANTPRVLDLRSLRKIVLADLPPVMSWLLSSFRIRTGMSISVCGWIPDASQSHPTYHTLLPNHSDLARFLSTAGPLCGKVDVSASGGKIEVTCSDESLTLLLELVPGGHWDIFFGQALGEFETLFSRFPVQTLCLIGELDDVREELWYMFLSQFPALRSLEVGGPGSAQLLFRALKHTPLDPVDRYAGAKTPVCGNLQSLTVEPADFLGGEFELILAMLHRRAFYELKPLVKFSLYFDSLGKGQDFVEDEIIMYYPEIETLCPNISCNYD